MVDLPGLSYGLAHLAIQVTTMFGLAVSARPSGVVLDVGHLRHIRWSKDGDEHAWTRYNRIMGQWASALEHAVPERLFATQETPAEAISAVKLLAKAAAAGQRIYTITGANAAIALPRLALDPATVDDIRLAVSAGREVTVHERPLDLNGWVGAGYIAIDPATGAGAYMITGGANGGAIAWFSGALLGLLSGALMAILLATGGVVGIVIMAALMVAIVALIAWAIYEGFGKEVFQCFLGGVLTGFDLGMLAQGAGFTRAIGLLVHLITGVFVPSNSLMQCT
jgi:hypothetical protein